MAKGWVVHGMEAKSVRWATSQMHENRTSICMAEQTVHHQADGPMETTTARIIKSR
jgi:hypothetical protein